MNIDGTAFEAPPASGPKTRPWNAPSATAGSAVDAMCSKKRETVFRSAAPSSTRFGRPNAQAKTQGSQPNSIHVMGRLGDRSTLPITPGCCRAYSPPSCRDGVLMDQKRCVRLFCHLPFHWIVVSDSDPSKYHGLVIGGGAPAPWEPRLQNKNPENRPPAFAFRCRSSKQRCHSKSCILLQGTPVSKPTLPVS